MEASAADKVRERKIDRLYAIRRGQVEVTLDDLRPFDAYAVTLTLQPT